MDIEKIILKPWKVNQRTFGNCGFAMILMHLAKYKPDYLRWLDTHVITPPNFTAITDPGLIPPSFLFQSNPTLTCRVILNAQRRLEKRRFFSFPNSGYEFSSEWEQYRDWYLIVALMLIFKQLVSRDIVLMCRNFGYYLYLETPQPQRKLHTIIDEINRTNPIPIPPEDDPDYEPGFDFAEIAAYEHRNRAIAEAKHSFDQVSTKSGNLALNTIGLKAYLESLNVLSPPNGIIPISWDSTLLLSELVPTLQLSIQRKSVDILENPAHKFNQFFQSNIKPIFTSMKPGSGAFVAVRVVKHISPDTWLPSMKVRTAEDVCKLTFVPQEFDAPYTPWYNHWIYCWKPEITFGDTANQIEIWTWGSKYHVSLDNIFHFFHTDPDDTGAEDMDSEDLGILGYMPHERSDHISYESLTVLIPSVVITFTRA